MQQRGKLYTFGNSTLTIKQWAERMGMNHWTFRSRLRRGWALSDAILTPVNFRQTRSLETAKIFLQALAA